MLVVALAGLARHHRGIMAFFTDPTRTTLIRQAFYRDLNNRFAGLADAVVKLVYTDDAFGLDAAPRTATTASDLIRNAAEWSGLPIDNQQEKFNTWLAGQVSEGVLSAPTDATASPWVSSYIQSSYLKGATRAYTDSKKGDLAAIVPGTVGTQDAFIKSAFGGPVAASKVKFLATQTYTNLKNITTQMEAQIQGILAVGIAQGKHPKVLAKEMVAKIEGMSSVQAKRLAQTEIVRAHAEGQLDSFEKMGALNVAVLPEFATAGDGKVCPKCADLGANVYTVAQARGLIPVHPNCRCAWLPANVGEPTTGQTPTSDAAKTIADKQAAKQAEADAAAKAKADKLAAEAEAAAAALAAEAEAAKKKAHSDKVKAGMQAAKEKKAAAAKAAEEAKQKQLEAEKKLAEAKAKALEQTKKIQMGMAKSNLAKKHNIGPDAYKTSIGGTHQKLKDEPLAKVLLEKKGKYLEDLTDEEAMALDGAGDVVEQLAVISGIKQPKVKKAPTAPVKPAPAPAAPVKPAAAPPAPVATSGLLVGDLPYLKKVKDLPGSTKPKLMEDTRGGKLWVVKEGLDPGHLKSEAAADALYRAAGVPVPLSGAIDTAEGPIKFSEFMANGKTLNEWRTGATAAEKKEMDEEISKGFVMDALLANYDVAGMSNDNIFVVGGVPYRIDNGGALTYRAQGGAKTSWGPVVAELSSLRDKKINSNTATIFANLTDADIHNQIRSMQRNREAILAAAPREVQATLAARMDYLQGMLPKTPTTERAAGAPAIGYGVTPDVVQRAKKAGINGITLAGDRADIEDNNILLYEVMSGEGGYTKINLKVTHEGSKKIGETLGSALGKVALPVAVDPDFIMIEEAAKTIATHYKKKTYNMVKIEKLQKYIKAAGKPAKGTKEWFYLDQAKTIAMYYDINQCPPLNSVVKFVPPPVKAATKSAFKVKSNKTMFAINEFKDGRATLTAGHSLHDNTCFDIDLGDGVIVKYVPRAADAGAADYSRTFQGVVEITVPGGLSEATSQKALAALETLGIKTAPPTPEYEELLYIHRTVYLRKDASQAAYKKIWDDNTLDDKTKLDQLKGWVASNYGIDLKKAPPPHYNPQGRPIKISEGQSARVWDRWDMSEDKLKKDMKEYTLQHTIGGLKESDMGRIPGAVDRMLQSGGELTSTLARMRKGVPLSTGGASSLSDIRTGGASYAFTRIKPMDSKKHGLFFKPQTLLRQDVVSYDSDLFGAIDEFHQRAADVKEWKDNAKNTSNEAIFKHGLSLVDDIDFIRVFDEKEKEGVIAAYKKAGITKLPDGRNVTDIVITTNGKPVRQL